MLKNIGHLFLFILCSKLSYAVSWSSLESKKDKIYFSQDYKKLAQECLSSIQSFTPVLEDFTGNRLDFKTPYLLEDYGNYINGFTDSIKRQISLSARQPSLASVADLISVSGENWCESVAIHEAVHMHHTTKTDGFILILRNIFGNIMQPNIFSPQWFTEGLAVYGESHFISPFTGRLNTGYFKSLIKAQARDGLMPTVDQAMYLPVDYPGRLSWYLYGSVFVEYLINKYGVNKVSEFIESYGASVPILYFNHDVESVFGKNLSDLWQDWVLFEENKSKSYVIDGIPMIHKGQWLTQFTYNEGKIYYVKNKTYNPAYGKKYFIARLIELDPETLLERTIFESDREFKAKIKRYKNKIYYSLNDLESGYNNVNQRGFGAVSSLYVFDLSSNQNQKIYKGLFRDFEVLDENNFLFIEDNPDLLTSSLMSFDKANKKKIQRESFEIFIGSINLFDDIIVFSAKDNKSNYNLYEYSAKSKVLNIIQKSPYIQATPFVSGDNIYFTSTYNGELSIIKHNKKTKVTSQPLEGSSSFSPFLSEDGNTVYFLAVDAYGISIYKRPLSIGNTLKVQKKENKAKESHVLNSINDKTSISYKKTDYSLSSFELKPFYRFLPQYFNFDKGKKELGLAFEGSNILKTLSYQAILGFNFSKSKPLYNFSLGTLLYNPLSLNLSFGNLDDNPLLTFTGNYPLYKSTGFIKALSLGLSSISEFNNKIKEGLGPEIGLALGWPGFMFSTSYGLEYYPLQENRQSIIGHMMKAQASQLLFTDFNLQGQFFWEYNQEFLGRYDDIIIIRGQSKRKEANRYFVASFDLSYHIATIRKGFTFFPYGFLDNIYGSVFLDYLNYGRVNKDYSYGIELKADNSLLFNYPLLIGLRSSFDRRFHPCFEVFVKSIL